MLPQSVVVLLIWVMPRPICAFNWHHSTYSNITCILNFVLTVISNKSQLYKLLVTNPS